MWLCGRLFQAMNNMHRKTRAPLLYISGESSAWRVKAILPVTRSKQRVFLHMSHQIPFRRWNTLHTHTLQNWHRKPSCSPIADGAVHTHTHTHTHTHFHGSCVQNTLHNQRAVSMSDFRPDTEWAAAYTTHTHTHTNMYIHSSRKTQHNHILLSFVPSEKKVWII